MKEGFFFYLKFWYGTLHFRAYSTDFFPLSNAWCGFGCFSPNSFDIGQMSIVYSRLWTDFICYYLSQRKCLLFNISITGPCVGASSRNGTVPARRVGQRGIFLWCSRLQGGWSWNNMSIAILAQDHPAGGLEFFCFSVDIMATPRLARVVRKAAFLMQKPLTFVISSHVRSIASIWSRIFVRPTIGAKR